MGMQVAFFALFSYCLPIFLGAQPLLPLAVVLGGGLLRCPPAGCFCLDVDFDGGTQGLTVAATAQPDEVP